MQRPVMVLIQPHIPMEFFDRRYLEPPSMHTLTDAIRRAAKVSSAAYDVVATHTT